MGKKLRQWVKAGDPKKPVIRPEGLSLGRRETITTEAVEPLIHEAIDSLAQLVRKRNSALAETLMSSRALHRHLYYFERILVLMTRELDDSRLPVILRSIETFERFEQAVARGE